MHDPIDWLSLPAWDPLCAVGSHHGTKRSAQICISLFSASIVPDRPRLAMALWKSNATCELLRASGTAAVTLLGEAQLPLLETLGVVSGRDNDKLGGLDLDTTELGDPFFPGGAGVLTCRTIDTMDLGDSILFVCSVARQERLSAHRPITWADAQKEAGEAFMERYRAKFARDVDWARPRMRW